MLNWVYQLHLESNTYTASLTLWKPADNFPSSSVHAACLVWLKPAGWISMMIGLVRRNGREVATGMGMLLWLHAGDWQFSKRGTASQIWPPLKLDPLMSSPFLPPKFLGGGRPGNGFLCSSGWVETEWLYRGRHLYRRLHVEWGVEGGEPDPAAASPVVVTGSLPIPWIHQSTTGGGGAGWNTNYPPYTARTSSISSCKNKSPKSTTLWAYDFYKSICPYVCLFSFEVPFKRQNPWKQVMERSGLRFENFYKQRV